MSSTLFFVVIALYVIYHAQPPLSAYKVTILKVYRCPEPDPPYESTGKVVFSIQPYKKFNRILVRGNATVNKDFRLLVRLTSALEKNGKISHNEIDFKDMTCRNMFVKIAMAELHLPYDTDTCMVHRGNYTFDKIDPNRIDSANSMMPAREAGINIWQLSMYGPDGTYFCVRLRVRIAHAK